MSVSERSRNELAFLERAIQFIDGAMSEAECDDFHAELRQSDVNLNLFAEVQLQAAIVRSAMRHAAYELPDTTRTDKHRFAKESLVLAATCLRMIAAYLLGSSRKTETARSDLSNTRLINASRARFFDEFAPDMKSNLVLKHEYTLTEGLIELAFPNGAIAIIESPAVFRVVADDCLAMDAGRCSVNAPRGAEGFRVDTPTMRVVDRGTRFMVSVGENSATEVQMVEGAADIYQNTQQGQNGDALVHLTNQGAMRFAGATADPGTVIPSLPQRYRSNLPDRVVRFEASNSADGRVEQLKSVTVQRGGQLQTVLVNELIGVNLIHFRSGPVTDVNGHLAAGSSLPGNRLSLLSDFKLNTGIINPGGSKVPLSTSPDSETPGFAVRFNEPVVNGAGPDVVFFELQCKTNPIDGDAFHVSPLEFSESSRAHTVRSYDLTLASREALPLSTFSLYRFTNPVNVIAELNSWECESSPVSLSFQAIAVGIDLSDLGFAIGESADGLFFQDAADDEKCIVDPVFIGGLPALKTSKVNP